MTELSDRDVGVPRPHGERAPHVQIIPINRIRISNPRVRNPKAFRGMVDNIATVGLKRPITVARDRSGRNDESYSLVCGQGRLEALQALGETEVPAFVVEATEADCYLMSLVENIARRQHSRLELLQAISELAERGYSASEIAQKVDLKAEYVSDLLQLLREGEERLVNAVERGILPIRLALEVVRSDDASLQAALIQAYQEKVLSSDQLMRIRRLIDRRRAYGKSYSGPRESGRRPTSAQSLVRAYEAEIRRQKLLIQKAEIGERRLLILVTALRRLLSDEAFQSLLRQEGLSTLPKFLSDELGERGR
jgi:ParB family chromosome partitioning protein